MDGEARELFRPVAEVENMAIRTDLTDMGEVDLGIGPTGVIEGPLPRYGWRC